jgi:SAM-dependent methyltransferase
MGNCVSCGNDLQVLRRYDFRSRAFRNVYRDRNIYRCIGCGLSQADISKVDEGALRQYYRSEYRAIARLGVGDSDHLWYRARAMVLAELAAEHLSRRPKRAFEVGAGYGYNLLALRQRFPGIQLFTDEFDESIELPEAIQRAELSKGRYDVIMLSHVLEHFTDPKSLIASAFKGLTMEGIIIVEVPNDVTGIFSFNGPDEPHLTFFTAATLTTLLGTDTVHSAGPPYHLKTVHRRARRVAARILKRAPIVSNLVATRRIQAVSSKSFAVRRSDGIFLRAVLLNSPSVFTPVSRGLPHPLPPTRDPRSTPTRG